MIVEGGIPPLHSPAPPKARAKQFSFFWRLLLKPGSPLLSCLLHSDYRWNLLSCLSRSHVHTSGTKPAMFSCNYLNGQPAKYIFPLIRQKTFCKKTKKGGMARDVTNRGGVRGGIPPGIHVPPAPPKARRSRFHLLLHLPQTINHDDQSAQAWSAQDPQTHTFECNIRCTVEGKVSEYYFMICPH